MVVEEFGQPMSFHKKVLVNWVKKTWSSTCTGNSIITMRELGSVKLSAKIRFRIEIEIHSTLFCIYSIGINHFSFLNFVN